MNKSRRIALLGLFLAAALMIGFIERAIPFQPPIPGVRLGLPNVVMLFALYCFSFPDCLLLTGMKCLLTALLAGSFVSFWYSLSGSLLSLVGMALLLRLGREKLSPVGISVAGAVLHNIGQLFAASLAMGTSLVMGYLPLLMVSGVITGFLTGTAVRYCLRLPLNLIKKQKPDSL